MPERRVEASKGNKDKKKDAAARVSQWKWLIIDEISMVSANFLAELDMHIRQIMTDVNVMKQDASHIDKAVSSPRSTL